MALAPKQTLNQVLSPQMRQGLEILQTPTLELEAMISQELEQNPTLEDVRLVEDANSSSEESWTPGDGPTDEGKEVEFYEKLSERLTQLSEDLAGGGEPSHAVARHTSEDDEKRQFIFDSAVAETTLHESLMEQLRLSGIEDNIKTICVEIIGNLDDRGYLTTTIEELALNNDWDWYDVEDALGHVQNMEPVGVASRDLRECLLKQLAKAGREQTLEHRMIDRHIDLLGRRRFPEIAKALGVSVHDVQEAAARIAHLEYNPGREYASVTHDIVSPDVYIERDSSGSYTVRANRDHLPKLRISRSYKDLIAQATTSSEVRSYLREKVRSGNFLINSLAHREETIVRISREIAKRQWEFFDKGPRFLKPMTMSEIAEVIEVHETTVSRAVAGKYASTPQGVLELRSLFSTGVKQADGEEVTNKKIKDLLGEIIDQEDPKKPLSDDRLVKLLMEQGIKVARRTVAKYRTEMGILSSSQRRVY